MGNQKPVLVDQGWCDVIIPGYSTYQPSRWRSESIRSDEGLTLETSAFESLYGGQFTLSTQLMKSNDDLTLQRKHLPSQNVSFPLHVAFDWHLLTWEPLRMKPSSQLNKMLVGKVVNNPTDDPFEGTRSGPQSLAK